jgi:hypothetical protein
MGSSLVLPMSEMQWSAWPLKGLALQEFKHRRGFTVVSRETER